MIGPDFSAPSAPLAERWSEAGAGVLDSRHTDSRDWWKGFDDPVLERLIGMAYSNNPSLLAAGVRVLETRARLGIAIGELYPQQQQLLASLSRNKLPLSVPFDLVDNRFWSTFLGAQVGWEIDLWGKIRRAVQSADRAYLASIADYDDVLVTLIADVASDYVEIRTLERRLVIARENIAKQRRVLTIAEARFREGVVSKRDVYQAQNVLGATEATLPQLTISLTRTRNALAVLLGLPPGTIGTLLGASSNIPQAPARVAVGIPADLLRRRPDVRRAELLAAAQSSQIGVAKADLLPALSLLGTIGVRTTTVGGASLADLFSARHLTYGAGPSVQWNIFNYGQINNNVRAQDARLQALLADYQNTVLKAQQEVENGLVLFLQSQAQAEALQRSADAAMGALVVAINQYKEGIADFTTVLNAEQNLFQAQDNLAVAQGNIPLGLIGVYRALGGGWQIRDGHGFVPQKVREEMEQRTDWGELLAPEQPAPALPGPADTGSTVRPPQW